MGASEPSDATKEFQTIQAPPAHPPLNVTVRAMSATELRVRWIVSFFFQLILIILEFAYMNSYINLYSVAC